MHLKGKQEIRFVAINENQFLLGGLVDNPLENVVQERIHRRNSLRRDFDVRMDLTKNYAHVSFVLMILLFLFSLTSDASWTASSFFSNLRNHGGGRISTRGLDMSRQCRFNCFRRSWRTPGVATCLLGNFWFGDFGRHFRFEIAYVKRVPTCIVWTRVEQCNVWDQYLYQNARSDNFGAVSW